MKPSLENRIFSLTDEMKEPAAQLIANWQSPLMFSLSEQLEDLGLPTHLAAHLEVNTVMTWACRVAYLTARVIERREPSPELWRLACEEEFDRTAKWFAESYTDAPELLDAAPAMMPRRDVLAAALEMTGCEDVEDLIDMANVGSSLMSTIEVHSVSGPLKDWSPAEDPAEVVGDLVRMVEEAHTEVAGTLWEEALVMKTNYEKAHGRALDCATADSALEYGRVQGLQIAADMIDPENLDKAGA